MVWIINQHFCYTGTPSCCLLLLLSYAFKYIFRKIILISHHKHYGLQALSVILIVKSVLKNMPKLRNNNLSQN